MSEIKVCQSGANQMLSAIVTGIGTMYYHLFQNNYTPTGLGETVLNFTEATFDSYAQQAVTWTGASTNGDGEAEIDGTAALTWTSTGSVTPNTIYGYYVTDGSNNLLYSEEFDSSTYISSNGDSITVPPKFILKSEY